MSTLVSTHWFVTPFIYSLSLAFFSWTCLLLFKLFLNQRILSFPSICFLIFSVSVKLPFPLDLLSLPISFSPYLHHYKQTYMFKGLHPSGSSVSSSKDSWDFFTSTLHILWCTMKIYNLRNIVETADYLTIIKITWEGNKNGSGNLFN